ncbi:protocatechuate 3 4-dioxygenase beta subunit [Paramyrothecium foliicola]|nr:protocatechuate 3 4-dioxygenase beta subunit [Paramyrothecium foliicola]
MRLTLSLAVALAASVVAHPGEDHSDELEQRRPAASLTQRNVDRRAAAITAARQKRGIHKRSLEDVLATDHNKTSLGYTPTTSPEILFAGQNSCVLTPDVTLGPYYVSGESIRTNLKEDEPGVDLILDYQVIDVDTCDPVPNLYLEIWHCNSTGVYGGVINPTNGNPDDATNIDKTWGRGIQPTDEDGVATFETLFPGHYTGRTIHIHLLAHANATLYANETLGNEIYTSHIGQTYFDQDLIDQVELLEPYNTNTQVLTTNAEDRILAEAANQDHDPVVEWTLLGDSVADGIFGWFAYGINTTITEKVTPAVFRYEDGGHANPDAGGGPGGPGGPGDNTTTPPSGGAPSNAGNAQAPSSGLLVLGQLVVLCLATGYATAWFGVAY